MGDGGGVGEDVVERGPLALVLIGAQWEFGCPVDEVVVSGEEFELWRTGFGIEIAHDDEVGMPPLYADRIRMCLELMADAHALSFSLFAASFGWQMKHIDIECVASCNDACHMEDVACCPLACVGANRLLFNGMEGDGGVEQGDIDAALVVGVGHDVAIAEVLQWGVLCEVCHHRVVLHLAETNQVDGFPFIGCGYHLPHTF